MARNANDGKTINNTPTNTTEVDNVETKDSSSEKMFTSININRMYEKICDQKLIKTATVTKDDLQKLDALVTAVNASPYTVTYIKRVDSDGDTITVPMAEYEIPEFIANAFIYPDLVVLATSFKTAQDLVVRPSYPDKKTIPTPLEVRSICDHFDQTFKGTITKKSIVRTSDELNLLFTKNGVLIGSKTTPQYDNFTLPVPLDAKCKFLFPDGSFSEDIKERRDHWWRTLVVKKS